MSKVPHLDDFVSLELRIVIREDPSQARHSQMPLADERFHTAFLGPFANIETTIGE